VRETLGKAEGSGKGLGTKAAWVEPALRLRRRWRSGERRMGNLGKMFGNRRGRSAVCPLVI
jgi:hypothetical protein